MPIPIRIKPKVRWRMFFMFGSANGAQAIVSFDPNR